MGAAVSPPHLPCLLCQCDWRHAHTGRKRREAEGFGAEDQLLPECCTEVFYITFKGSSVEIKKKNVQNSVKQRKDSSIIKMLHTIKDRILRSF